MEHIVYLDKKAKEDEKLLSGSKSIIIRGAAGRKIPYGKVFKGDNLYFINNDGSGQVFARAMVTSVFNSEKLTKDQSAALISENQNGLKLSDNQIKRWSGKRYLVLVTVTNFEIIQPFTFNRSAFVNMDDWLAVENIDSAKKT